MLIEATLYVSKWPTVSTRSVFTLLGHNYSLLLAPVRVLDGRGKYEGSEGCCNRVLDRLGGRRLHFSIRSHSRGFRLCANSARACNLRCQRGATRIPHRRG